MRATGADCDVAAWPAEELAARNGGLAKVLVVAGGGGERERVVTAYAPGGVVHVGSVDEITVRARFGLVVAWDLIARGRESIEGLSVVRNALVPGGGCVSFESGARLAQVCGEDGPEEVSAWVERLARLAGFARLVEVRRVNEEQVRVWLER